MAVKRSFARLASSGNAHQRAIHVDTRGIHVGAADECLRPRRRGGQGRESAHRADPLPRGLLQL